MDKLIELLNEYDGEDLEYGFIDGEIRRKVRNFDNESNTWKQVVWYTKQFGFIKWLVDNDKIDRKKLEKRPFSDGLVYSDSDCTVYRSDTTYEMLLMLLSISDTPIEDLISYLK